MEKKENQDKIVIEVTKNELKDTLSESLGDFLTGNFTVKSQTGDVIGIVRRIDELGRVVLPIEMRRALEAEEKSPMAISCNAEDGTITIKKFTPSDTFTGSTKNLIEFMGRFISTDTIHKLNESAGLKVTPQTETTGVQS